MISKKEVLTRAILALIITNALGYLLKFFALDDYVILLGFRVKLNLMLPCLFFLNYNLLSELKETAVSAVKNKIPLQLFIFLLPFAVFLGGFYIAGKADLGDPEYFYEFGLSSIFDFPIYVIWNLPQLICFIILAKYIAEKLNSKTTALIFIVLFSAYHLIPVKGDVFDPVSFAGFIIGAVAAGLIILNFKNPFSAAISLFFLLWSYFLFWGTGSKEAIHLLLAKRYDAWEGLLWMDEKLIAYAALFHFGVSYLGILPASLLYKKKA